MATEEVGTLVKVSKKGILWKAWEIDMNLGSVAAGQGTVNMETFTLPDDSAHAELVQECQSALNEGRAIGVKYDQWLVHSLYNMADDHMITGVKRVGTAESKPEKP